MKYQLKKLLLFQKDKCMQMKIKKSKEKLWLQYQNH